MLNSQSGVSFILIWTTVLLCWIIHIVPQQKFFLERNPRATKYLQWKLHIALHSFQCFSMLFHVLAWILCVGLIVHHGNEWPGWRAALAFADAANSFLICSSTFLLTGDTVLLITGNMASQTANKKSRAHHPYLPMTAFSDMSL